MSRMQFLLSSCRWAGARLVPASATLGPGPRPDQGLPGGGQGGYPSQPIYHPGHPEHGLPAHPAHPIAPGGSGGQPSHPIHIPGVPDQGLPPGTEIPPGEISPPLPELPPEYADQLVIAVHQPGAEEWKVTAYEVGPDQGLPPQPPYPDQGLPPTTPPAPQPVQQQRTAPPPRPGMPPRR